MESSLSYPRTRFFSASLFYLALSSSLFLHATSQAITPSGDQVADADADAAPSAAEVTTPPVPEDPAAPLASPGAQPATPALPEGPAAPSSGTIKRLTKQQILASIPAGRGEGAEPFITSPSGRYVGYLLRRETAPGAGGFGNDFCYLQVRDAATGKSVWESDCTPASVANACTLAFTMAGLEVFDGSRSAWDAGVDAEHLETLELVDEGDMRIRTRDGELAWKASDEPLANQECGAPGSPGLASVRPPFGAPVEDSRNLPFGQPSQGKGQQQSAGTLFNQQPLGGTSVQPLGGESGQQQPLVDNTPFDSAGWRVLDTTWFTLAASSLLLLASVAVHGSFF